MYEITQNPMAEHAEVAVLGAMLTDALAVTDATGILSESDFALDSHQRVFRSILRLVRDGKPADLLTVMDDLKAHRELDSIGGVAYLTSLSDDVGRGMNIVTYARMVRGKSVARRALGVLRDGMARLVEQSEPVDEVVDAVTKALSLERPSESKRIADVVARIAESLDTPSGSVLSTGIPSLDAVLQGGWRTGELGIIAAYPSGGKSALCRQTERAAVNAGAHTHAFSVEITDERWIRHHATREARLEAWETRDLTRLSPTSRDRFLGGLASIERWPYLIDDSAGLSIDQVLSRARLSVMRNETKLVTIDFLQLLIQNHKNEVAEIADIVWRLKRFAKEHGVAVVALSQLTEDRGTGRTDERPRLNQMRGSGSIRQAADVIVFSHRPEEDGHKTGLDELVVAKQRDGLTGMIPVVFNVGTLCFEPRG